MIHRHRCEYNIEKDLCDVIMCGWTGVVYGWENAMKDFCANDNQLPRSLDSRKFLDQP